jgi:hypothetical protein
MVTIYCFKLGNNKSVWTKNRVNKHSIDHFRGDQINKKIILQESILENFIVIILTIIITIFIFTSSIFDVYLKIFSD